MKKQKKKMFLVFMILITGFICGIKNVSAQTATLTSEIVDDITFYVKRNGTTYFVGEFTKYDIKDSISGVTKAAFCIEPGEPETNEPDGYTKTDWSEIGLSEEVKQKILLITYYGYQYPNHQTLEYRAATQALLWEAIMDDEERKDGSDATWYVGYTKRYYDEDLQEYVTEDWDLSEEREVIINLVEHHNDKPSFAEESFNVNVGETLIITDTKNVLKNYDVYESNGTKVEIEGNNLKITPTTSGTIELKFVRKQVYSDSYYVYYGKFTSGESAQNMITGGNVDPIYFSVNLTSTVNSAAIKVVKIDSSTKEVIERSNIKFKICKEDGNCITHIINDEETDIFYTNNDGTFITEKLEKGKYYLIELEQTIDGYLWNKESLEFEIGDNIKLIDDETYGLIYQINFENKPVKGSIELTKTGEIYEITEEGIIYTESTLQGVIFGLYAKEDIYDNSGNLIYSKDSEISKYETDSNGNINISNLYLGKYYIKEIKTDSNYILDNKIYDIDLSYKDNKTENISYAKEIKNYLSKGTLNFTKKDSLTNEVLKDATIDIYTEDDTLIYSLKTDINGNLTINNLPLGKYYIIEKTSPTGYRLNNEKMYFDITTNEEVVSLTMFNEKEKIKEVFNVKDTASNDNSILFVFTCSLLGIGFIIYDKMRKKSHI